MAIEQARRRKKNKEDQHMNKEWNLARRGCCLGHNSFGGGPMKRGKSFMFDIRTTSTLWCGFRSYTLFLNKFFVEHKQKDRPLV